MAFALLAWPNSARLLSPTLAASNRAPASEKVKISATAWSDIGIPLLSSHKLEYAYKAL